MGHYDDHYEEHYAEQRQRKLQERQKQYPNRYSLDLTSFAVVIWDHWECKQLEPQQVVDLLNEYRNALVDKPKLKKKKK